MIQRTEQEMDLYSNTILGRLYLKSDYTSIVALSDKAGKSYKTVQKYLGKNYLKDCKDYNIGVVASVCEALDVELSVEIFKEYI